MEYGLDNTVAAMLNPAIDNCHIKKCPHSWKTHIEIFRGKNHDIANFLSNGSEILFIYTHIHIHILHRENAKQIRQYVKYL